jgi:hypothetical protein
VLISGALSDVAHGGDLVECEPQRVTGDGPTGPTALSMVVSAGTRGRPGKPKNAVHQQHVNARNWSATAGRHSSGIASVVSDFSGGAAGRGEGGLVSVSASGPVCQDWDPIARGGIPCSPT